MNALIDLKNRLWERWQLLAPRDRVLLGFWSAGMALLLVWFGLLSPLYRRIATLEQRVPELESRLGRMRAQAADVARPANAVQTSGGDLRSALFGQLAQRKLKAELRTISTTRAELRLPNLAIPEALELLDSLRRETGCRVATLTIKRDKPTDHTVRIVVELERLP